MSEYNWLEKRVLRSVDQLRLWADNPRLNPEEKHVNLADFSLDLISQSGEKDSFLKLINSIASRGYIPADPIVVWKNTTNNKYYVAEGNRRTLALKLLRNPSKAPKSIRSYIRNKSELISRDSIEKIRVCIAPSYDECEWYINQRHAGISIQKWSRLQQQQWIATLYDKYDADIDKITSITGLSKSELEYTLRILKIRDFALEPFVFDQLSADEQESVRSHRIPISILERWFTSAVVKERWGFDFDGADIVIVKNEYSFLSAYATWIKLVIHKDDPDIDPRINTRTITRDLEEILDKLPRVSFEEPVSETSNGSTENTGNQSNEANNSHDSGNDSPSNTNNVSSPPILDKNPDRNQIIIPKYYINTTNFKLNALFKEFKNIPVTRYNNCIAVSLRVFLDIAINEYITAEGCKDDLVAIYRKAYHDIALKQRLEYIKQNKLTSRTPPFKVVSKLVNPSNDYSLDTLNNYVHGNDTHHTSKRFLNSFWDFLFPLFEEIMDIESR